MNAAYEAQKSAESNIDELSEQIKSFESEIAFTDAKSVLSEYETTSEHREGGIAKAVRFSHGLNWKTNKVARSRRQAPRVGGELDDLRLKNEELESSISSTSEALRLELEESRAELESARTNFEAELNSAHEAQRSAESNVEEMNEQIKSYEAELLAIGSLELQLDEAQAKLTAYELSSGDLRKELDSAQLELENAGSNVAAAEAKVRASELELSDLRLKVEEKESQISGRNSTVQNLEQRLFEMEELSEK